MQRNVKKEENCSSEQKQNTISLTNQELLEMIQEIRNSEIPLPTQDFIIRLLKGELSSI